MKWLLLDPRMTPEHLGFIPEFLNEADPRPARAQIDERYAHGGGWRPVDGFTIDDDGSIRFPGDAAPLPPLAQTMLRGEAILFYEHDWLLILQRDGTFEIARVD